MKRFKDYDAFAWLYNREWTSFANNIFPALKTITGDNIPDKARILDLCCGTGQLAKILTENGYRVTGIDGSAEMLRYARINAPAARFLLRDARAFQLPPEYDAVFSTFDALNHILTIEELQRVFNNVNQCLVKGGIFIFDLTMKKHFEERTQDYEETVEKPDFLYYLRTEYDTEKRLNRWKCTVFQPAFSPENRTESRPVGKRWKRSEIQLSQTWYPEKDIRVSLKKAGFKNIKAYTFTPMHELVKATPGALRVFFYAQKP